MTTKARFFADAAEFRDWLREHHEKQTELWVGFHKKHKGQAGLTYSEAVEEALCFGWIDGVLNRIDADRYMHRFSHRQPRSTWSRRNVVRAEALIAAGRMHPAGLAVFSARTEARTVHLFLRTHHLPPLAGGLRPAVSEPPGGVDLFPVSAGRVSAHHDPPRSPSET